MRAIHRVREHEVLDVPLGSLLSEDSLQLYPEVVGRGYLQASLKGNRISLAAGNFVGLIPLNDRIAIEVIPKVGVNSVGRMLRLSGIPPVVIGRTSRRYDRDVPVESMLDLVAQGFADAVDEVLRSGVSRVYEQRVEDLSAPRGRILITGTLRNLSAGRRQRVAASWYEPTDNTPENMLIKYALWVLGRLYVETQPRAGQLRITTYLTRLYSALGRITLDVSKGFLSTLSLKARARLFRDRPYYQSAVELGLLIAQHGGLSIEREGGEIVLPSLVVNMEDLFENYVRETLRTKLGNSGFIVRDGNAAPPLGGRKALFDDAARPEATPDVVVSRANVEEGTRGDPAVIEVKYKDSGPTRDDLNQAIVYGVSYRAVAVVVVWPRGSGRPVGLHYVGKTQGTAVYEYVIDLQGDPPAQEEAFASAIRSLFGPMEQTGAAA